jgi:hypothetical protein
MGPAAHKSATIIDPRASPLTKPLVLCDGGSVTESSTNKHTLSNLIPWDDDGDLCAPSETIPGTKWIGDMLTLLASYSLRSRSGVSRSSSRTIFVEYLSSMALSFFTAFWDRIWVE